MAVVRLRLVRALVVDVGNSITVVIRIWTPIIILKSVEILCIHWTRIVHIDNTVPIIILIRTPIFVFERIEVLRLIGAPIQIIDNAVAISIPAARMPARRTRRNDERGPRRRTSGRIVLVGDHQRRGCRF